MAKIVDSGLRRCVSYSGKENLPVTVYPRKRIGSARQSDLDETNKLTKSIQQLSIEGRVRHFEISRIEGIPNDLLYLIFSKLNIRDSINLGLCSRYLLSHLPVALRDHAKRVQSSYIMRIPLGFCFRYPQVFQAFTKRSFCLMLSPCPSGLEWKKCFKKWLMTLLKVLHTTPALNNRVTLYKVLMRQVFIRDGLPPEFFLKFLETEDDTLKYIVVDFLLNKCVEERDLVCLNKLERIVGDFLTTSLKLFFKEGRVKLYLALNRMEEAVEILNEFPKEPDGRRDSLIYAFGEKCLVLDQLEGFFWAMSVADCPSTRYLLLSKIYAFCRRMLAEGHLDKVADILAKLPDSSRKRHLIDELIDAYIKKEDIERVLSLINKLSDEDKVKHAVYKLVCICIRKKFLERAESLIKEFLRNTSDKDILLYDLSLYYLERGDLAAVLRLTPEFTEGYWGRSAILLKRIRMLDKTSS